MKTVFQNCPENPITKHVKNTKKTTKILILKIQEKTPKQKTPILRFGRKKHQTKKHQFLKIGEKQHQKNTFLTTIDLAGSGIFKNLVAYVCLW